MSRITLHIETQNQPLSTIRRYHLIPINPYIIII